MNDLDNALRLLYEAFPDAPDDETITDDEVNSVLFLGPRAALGADGRLIRLWTPRILGLLVGSSEFIWTEHVSREFDEAGWHEWPAQQRAAVLDVLRAWWRAMLTTHPGNRPVNDALLLLTKMVRDVRPWLATWSTIGGVAAARQLVDHMTQMVYWRDWPDGLDEDETYDHLGRWLLRYGVDILTALPEGDELDAAFARLAVRENELWWVWWPTPWCPES
jgi:hypothetical protein